jgi:hypothetical protein
MTPTLELVRNDRLENLNALIEAAVNDAGFEGTIARAMAEPLTVLSKPVAALFASDALRGDIVLAGSLFEDLAGALGGERMQLAAGQVPRVFEAISRIEAAMRQVIEANLDDYIAELMGSLSAVLGEDDD